MMLPDPVQRRGGSFEPIDDTGGHQLFESRRNLVVLVEVQLLRGRQVAANDKIEIRVEDSGGVGNGEAAVVGAEQGKGDEAADAMQDMADQLGEMSDEMAELEDLEMSLEQLSQSKNQMRCEKCGGGGCKSCQGSQQFGCGNGEGQGDGMGKGNGAGDRLVQREVDLEGLVDPAIPDLCHRTAERLEVVRLGLLGEDVPIHEEQDALLRAGLPQPPVALEGGAAKLPWPVRKLMTAMSKVMTTTAYYF